MKGENNKDIVKAQIDRQEITEELQQSYLDYAMSVIVSRALPDVRDGLKPVHRRILWDMWDSGLTSTNKFRKSANVIGQVLGRYHPHGDTAVYDAMVRMAQDFSLRYTLVEGQGNFGCFTKDTKVKLTDGRDASFEELVKDNNSGKRNFTYSVNKLGLIAIAKIKNPRLTKKNTDLVKITLDNGAEIRCTPNHLFMLRDGTYREARLLKALDSLMPLYTKLSKKTDRLNREGYILIHQNKIDEWVPAHHLADNYNLTQKLYSLSAGRVRHHIDFNKLNNNPDNVKRLHWGEHWQIHYTNAKKQHANADYRKKIAAGRKEYWSHLENRIQRKEMLSERNLQNWQNQEYRENMRQLLSRVNKEYVQAHPEKRREYSLRATKTLKRLWQDPEYRSLMSGKIIKGNQNHATNRTGKLKFLNVCKEALKDSPILNASAYQEARNKVYPYGRATLWETGLDKYFQNNPELVLQEVNNNHKVVKVETLKEKENVYDLTIDGTHNFCLAAGIFVHNSVDGDSAAAYRYTEARLSKIAEELLKDIDKETVDWQPNYDNTREEPKVLPAKLPSLLINGSVGIAVGMATNIPPHNLTEIIDATVHLLGEPKSHVTDLLEYVKGPDFPTGGIIYDKRAIQEAYATGRGAITTRGLAEITERKNNQYDIVISEIPYQVNRAELIIKIAELVQEKKIEGIRDVRDESDKETRIVIELKNDVPPQKILNQLYKHTDLQKDFHMNLLALAKGGIQPQLMSLKDVLQYYIEHRNEIVRRRAEFDLKKARERAHILEGLVKALDQIDKIISTIKKSADKEEAHANLIKIFKFSDLQATAILEMRLQALAALEREKLEDELKEKKKLIKELELLLRSPEMITGVIKSELLELKEKFGDERRTKVVLGGLKEFREEDLVPQEEAVITLSESGYIKRSSPDMFKSQKRGGKGLIGSDVGDEDFIKHFVNANTHDNILFFTDSGKVFQTKVYEIPVATRTSKGKAVHNFLEIPTTENISAIVSYPVKGDKVVGEDGFLVMVTKNGVIKKTSLEDFLNVRRSGIIALTLKKDDLLKWVNLSSGGDEIIIVTANGQAIRFKEKDCRPMGRTASGVTAIRLKKGDAVSGMEIAGSELTKSKEAQLLTVMALGYAKRTPLSQYKVQRRGGSGIKTAKITGKTGQIIAAKAILAQEQLLALSAKGQIIKTEIKTVRIAGRATQGVKIMSLKVGDKLAGIVCL